MNRTLCIIAFAMTILAQRPNYNGGNDLNTIYNNPDLMDAFIKKIHGHLPEACETIPGVGKAILSIKQ